MNKIRIVTDSKLDRNPYGLIAGIIYFEINGLCFPEKDWSDFPVKILSWWIESLYKLKYEKSTELLFMDGPYYIRATKISEEVVEVTGYERRVKNDIPVFINQVSIKQLQQTIYRNANRVYQESIDYGWQSDKDVEDLKFLISKYSNI